MIRRSRRREPTTPRQFVSSAYPLATSLRRTVGTLAATLRTQPGNAALADLLETSIEQAFVAFLDAPTPASLHNLKQVWLAFDPALGGEPA